MTVCLTRSLRSLLLCFLCLLSFSALSAQEPPYTLRVEVRLVSLDVAVVDARGRFVRGLEKENFRVYEDEVEQAVTHFAALDAPLRVALLVETSPAVYLIQAEHLAAAYTLLDLLRPEDVVALARYDQRWQLVSDFNRDKGLLASHLRQLNYSLGMAELNLFDALGETLDWLGANDGSTVGRRAVLLIGTGLDTGSRLAQTALEEKLLASDVTLFAIATGSLLRAPAEGRGARRAKAEALPASEPDAAFLAADRRLEALTHQTGGRAYFPPSAAELRTAYREIGERLRHTYSLGYVPRERTRSSFRTLRVVLVDAAGRPLPYRVLARRSYFFPASPE